MESKTIEDILIDFGFVTDFEKVDLLLKALDLMSKHPTRTKGYCIALAMGYTQDYDNHSLFHK